MWLSNVPFELQIKSKFLQALLSDLLAVVHIFHNEAEVTYYAVFYCHCWKVTNIISCSSFQSDYETNWYEGFALMQNTLVINIYVCVYTSSTHGIWNSCPAISPKHSLLILHEADHASYFSVKGKIVNISIWQGRFKLVFVLHDHYFLKTSMFSNIHTRKHSFLCTCIQCVTCNKILTILECKKVWFFESQGQYLDLVSFVYYMLFPNSVEVHVFTGCFGKHYFKGGSAKCILQTTCRYKSVRRLVVKYTLHTR